MDFDQLINDLRLLRADFAGLGDRLAAASDDLKASGVPVSLELQQEIAEGRRRFLDLHEEARQFLREMVRDSVPADMRSLEHMEEVVRQVRESHQKTLEDQLCRDALVLVERTRCIDHRDPSKRVMLQEVHRCGNELVRRLRDPGDGERCQIARSVLSDAHSLAALLRLMADVLNADESQLEAWEDRVEADFGKPVRIAATSRRLFIIEKPIAEDAAVGDAAEQIPGRAAGGTVQVDVEALVASEARSAEPPEIVVQVLETESRVREVVLDGSNGPLSVAPPVDSSPEPASSWDESHLAEPASRSGEAKTTVVQPTSVSPPAEHREADVAKAAGNSLATVAIGTTPLADAPTAEPGGPTVASFDDGVFGESELRDTADKAEAKGPPEGKDSGLLESVDLHAKEATELIPDIPEDLVSFERFCGTFYLSGCDQVEQVPWKSDKAKFAASLRAMTERELAALRLRTVWLLSRAIEILGEKPLVYTQDIEACAVLYQASASSLSSRDERRSQLLRTAAQQEMDDVRLAAFLEALRPTRGETLSPNLIDQLMGRCGFQTSLLRELIRKALILHGHGVAIIDTLKERLAEEHPEPPEVYRRRLDAARTHFREEIMRLWSAAGGNIKTTHCREAWDRFMEEIQPTVKDLFPLPNGKEDWDTAEMDKKCRRFLDIHRKIADRREAKHEDRRRMDRAAQRIVDMAGEINDLMERLQQSSDRAESHTEQLIPTQELRALLDGKMPDDPVEKLCVDLLRHIFGGDESNIARLSPLMLRVEDFVRLPDLLGVFPPFDIQGAASLARDLAVSVTDVVEPLHAAALLLTADGVSPEGSVAELLDRLQERSRHDLLDRLRAGLTRTDAAKLRRAIVDERNAVSAVLVWLHEHWRHLDELAEPIASHLAEIYVEGERRRDLSLDEDVSYRLLRAWLEGVCQHAAQAEDAAVRNLRRRAAQAMGSSRIAALAAIRQRNYLDAQFALGESTAQSHTAKRETLWRADATLRFPDPLRTLDEASQTRNEHAELFADWRRGITGGSQTADRPLRTKFARLMFASTEKEKTNKPRGDNTASEAFIVSCQELARWIADLGYNPSYLPQLHSYSELALLTPWERVASPALIERLRGQIAQHPGRLCAFLTPRLQEVIREDILRDFATHGLTAAVVDDLDLCRLVNPGSRHINMVLGLLEIILEQQNRRVFSPFARHDGQHMRCEMFVGRREEAEKLCKTAEYSRLFSGRKLGKTALLKFIEQTYDGQPLASGNTLRVLYVNGIGANTESEVVARILAAMSSRLTFLPECDPSSLSDDPSLIPSKTLMAAVTQFIGERPTESLLIMLDEADLFVESQIEAYSRDREKSLSFCIRSQVESAHDSRGLPRVRFIFSGYRVTHMNAGAWAGAWGDVLRLRPLDPTAATELVQGPLGRLGIDAADVARSVAWRCGYQPAIILAFGRQLLEETQGDRIGAEEVASAFDKASVQGEIRTVVDSNFQGNGQARIVFVTLLWEFSERRTGEGVPDLAECLLNRLKSIDSNTDWLQQSDEGSALRQITGMVNDFVRRQLLREARSENGGTTHFLRFPHHLPVLAEELSRDPESKIRDDIAAYRRQQGGATDRHARITCLLPAVELAKLQETVACPPDSVLPVHAAVVATSWAEAIPLRLVNARAEQVDASDPQLTSWLSSRFLTVTNVSADQLDAILCHRPADLPPPLLVGGADLFRMIAVRDRDRDELFQYSSLSRVSRPMLSWWFSRFRGLELDADWHDRIAKCTGGVPFLTGLLDRALRDRHPGEVNVSGDEFGQVLLEYERRRSVEAIRIVAGSAAERLEKRELEILQMVAAISTGDARVSGQPIKNDLTIDWELYRESCEVEPLSPRDYVAMLTVQGLGFLPTLPDSEGQMPLDRFVGIASDDPVITLLEAAGCWPCRSK